MKTKTQSHFSYTCIYQFFEGEREFIHHLDLLLFRLDLRLSGIFYNLSLHFVVFSRVTGDS